MEGFKKVITIIVVIYLLIGLIHVFMGFPWYGILTWPAPYIVGFMSGWSGASNTP